MKCKYGIVCVLLSLIVIIGCAYRVDASAKNSKPVMVLSGSSSIRRWKKAKKVFKSYKVINVAIGGSTVIQWNSSYYKRILEHKPDVVLFYCGANDIQDGNATPGIVNADNTIQFLKKVSKKLKASKIYFISINHSIRNSHAWGEIDTSNRIVKQFCIKEKNIYYINIVNASVLADGTPNPALFIWDGLHPSKQGFKVWNTVIGDRINRSR